MFCLDTHSHDLFSSFSYTAGDHLVVLYFDIFTESALIWMLGHLKVMLQERKVWMHLEKSFSQSETLASGCSHRNWALDTGRALRPHHTHTQTKSLPFGCPTMPDPFELTGDRTVHINIGLLPLTAQTHAHIPCCCTVDSSRHARAGHAQKAEPVPCHLSAGGRQQDACVCVCAGTSSFVRTLFEFWDHGSRWISVCHLAVI